MPPATPLTAGRRGPGDGGGGSNTPNRTNDPVYALYGLSTTAVGYLYTFSRNGTERDQCFVNVLAMQRWCKSFSTGYVQFRCFMLQK